MKKNKLFMPIIGIASLSATIAPITMLSSCGNNGSSEYVTKEEIKYIQQINSYLSGYTNLCTCHKAFTTIKALGFDLANYKLSNGESEFVYDNSVKQFIIMHGDDVVACSDGYKKPSNIYDLWHFVNTYDKDAKYSQYLKDGYVYTGELVVSTGLDVGSNINVKNIKYVADPKVQKNVVLRTYSDILTIDAQNDTINHFETANNVYVTGDYQSNYREAGRIAYLQIQNSKFTVGYVDDKDCCSIDTFEALGTVTGSRDDTSETQSKYVTKGVVYTSVGNEVDNIQPWYNTTPVLIDTMQQLFEKLSDGKSAFIRLNSDIAFDSTYKQMLINNTGVIGSTRSIILDLNSHSITDKEETSLSTSVGRISITAGAALILMDTNRGTNGVVLYDHSIIVEGDSITQANFILNGANIYYNATSTAANRGAVYVGHTGETTDTYKSRFFMYGGSITASKPAEIDTNAIGISPRNNGAYVQIIYGQINADTGCISSNGKYDGTYIDIIGGEFESDSDNVCIYHPQSGNLHISGGSFKGGTCINFRDGVLNISGGNFVANGYDEDPEPKGGTAVVDGSVILIDANNDYGKDVSVTISGSAMVSMYAYILRGIGDSSYTGLVDVDFFGGTFIYRQGSSGYKISDNIYDNFVVRQEGGNWTKW